MNDFYDQLSQSSILKFAKKIVGKTLNTAELIKPIPSKYKDDLQDKKTKGNLGSFVEKYYFGINPGNEAAPDFLETGLELKTHPVKKIRGGYSSKERLVLGMISYDEIVSEEFKKSKFYKKNKDILLMSYLHDKRKSYLDYPFLLVEFLKYERLSIEDKNIILDDWKKIRSKVRSGRAHELSEGDTMYLSACTKSSSSKIRRSQPNSDVPAKPRAFSYKNSFMTYYVNSVLSNSQLLENDLGYKKDADTFDDFIYKKLNMHRGKTINDLYSEYGDGLNSKSKSLNRVLIQRILGSKKNIIPEFEKADVSLRVIRVTKGGSIKENISLPTFKFKELVDEKVWDETDTYAYISRRFLFVMFREDTRGDYRLDSSSFFSMSEDDIEKCEEVWEKTKEILLSGEIVSRKVKSERYKYMLLNNFPSQSETEVLHVRPHGRNRDDTHDLPVVDKKTKMTKFTKQSFWLNKDYIEKQLGLDEN